MRRTNYRYRPGIRYSQRAVEIRMHGGSGGLLIIPLSAIAFFAVFFILFASIGYYNGSQPATIAQEADEYVSAHAELHIVDGYATSAMGVLPTHRYQLVFNERRLGSAVFDVDNDSLPPNAALVGRGAPPEFARWLALSDPEVRALFGSAAVAVLLRAAPTTMAETASATRINAWWGAALGAITGYAWGRSRAIDPSSAAMQRAIRANLNDVHAWRRTENLQISAVVLRANQVVASLQDRTLREEGRMKLQELTTVASELDQAGNPLLRNPNSQSFDVAMRVSRELRELQQLDRRRASARPA